jgi:hypothetical protein
VSLGRIPVLQEKYLSNLLRWPVRTTVPDIQRKCLNDGKVLIQDL